jgi:hypothetical protein
MLGATTKAVLAVGLAISASAASWSDSEAALPPQGVYEQCRPGQDACLRRLEAIRSAGFSAVLNYMQWYASPAELQRYAGRAEELGLSLIYPLNAPQWRGHGSLLTTYRDLTLNCPCTDDDGFAAWAISLVRNEPSTWGWYIGDEVDAAELPAVQTLGARVRELDASHPQLYISYENASTNGDNLRPFGAVADFVGSDYYPIGTPFGVDATGDIAAQVQRIADAGARRSAVVLQAFSWDQYPHSAQIVPRWPTRAEMARQRDLALARARPGLILWYSFFDVARSDEPARRLDDLAQAAFSPEPAIQVEGAREEAPLASDGRAGEFVPPPASAFPATASPVGRGTGARQVAPARMQRRCRRGRPARRRRCRARKLHAQAERSAPSRCRARRSCLRRSSGRASIAPNR